MSHKQGYYAIVSRLSGLALDIDGASTSPGSRVIPYGKHLNDNQLWYDDHNNGTIRSKLNGFCLSLDGDQLVVKPHQQGDTDQLWERTPNGHIRHRQQHTRVLDVYGGNQSSGAKVGPYEVNGGQNQLWDFEFHDHHGSPPIHRHLFRIVSAMNGKVLDVKGAKAEPETKVIMWSKTNPAPPNQLWYLDYAGNIHSALNGFVLHAKATGKAVKTTPYTGDINQFWTQEPTNSKIWNRGGTGECLDIAKEDKDDGAKVVSYHYKGSSNQHWTFEYV